MPGVGFQKIHNEIASIAAMAKSILAGLDPARLETPVQTASLRLILETLLSLTTAPDTLKVGQGAADAVQHRVSLIEQARAAHIANEEKQQLEAERRAGSA